LMSLNSSTVRSSSKISCDECFNVTSLGDSMKYIVRGRDSEKHKVPSKIHGNRENCGQRIPSSLPAVDDCRNSTSQGNRERF
jgi:hypothetical protein